MSAGIGPASHSRDAEGGEHAISTVHSYRPQRLRDGCAIPSSPSAVMPDFPAHASPAFPPVASPRPQRRDRSVSELHLDHKHDQRTHPPLVSPAFTPPHTPFPEESQRPDRQPRSIPVEPPDQDTDGEQARLLPKLPEVHCEVRARIPTTTGQEMFLHLYHNNVDDKEHLAIVFGPHIRSKSLDAPRPGETERDRMIRGAYVGTLYPGRTSSRLDQIRRDAGVPSPRPSAGFLGQLNGPAQQATPPSPSASSEASTDGSEFESSYPLEFGPPLVRIHSECYTGETVWSARCDCGEQLDEAARLMSLPAPTPASTPGSDA
ncbi:GTP cyclohydrolase II, partial [Friedmanniomyces endolithicus]